MSQRELRPSASMVPFQPRATPNPVTCTPNPVTLVPTPLAARSSAYGLGLYFAAHPLYSHCIVPCHADCAGGNFIGYFLIRVRMLLGNVKDYKEKEDTAIQHTPEGFHSWKGTEGNMKETFGPDDIKNNPDARTLKQHGEDMGRQHITQTANMVYPEYIIRYTRE